MSKNKILIAPSLLSSDMGNFANQMAILENHIDYVHCDVMDGHFVPNLTFGAPVIKWLKKHSKKPLDVHLMIEKPEKWIEDYAKAGLKAPDYLTFHIEATTVPLEIIHQIHNFGINAGIAFKPNTQLHEATPLLPLVEQILIMTVEPGFGGQAFIEKMVMKIEMATKMSEHLQNQIIAVDGGINVETAQIAATAGARLLVAGASIYGNPDPCAAATEIRNSAENAL